LWCEIWGPSIRPLMRSEVDRTLSDHLSPRLRSVFEALHAGEIHRPWEGRAAPPGFSTYKGRVPARDGLSAGGRWIRTIGPAPAKGSSGRCQSETAARKAEPLTGSGPKRQCLPGVAAHTLSLRGGTASSNPSSSSGESSKLRRRASRRRLSSNWTRHFNG
jgi:hypothetical protein